MRLNASITVRARCLAVCLALVVASAGGCVQRRLTIRTNPPGALVYVDNYEIGTTPVSTDYIYYGTRKIRLVKDGFETLEIDQFVPPPWYEVFPLDFVSENVIPWELRDERAVDFQMRPQMVTPTHQLLSRAQDLRSGSQVPGFVPPPAAPPNTGTAVPEWVPSVTAPTWPLPSP